MIAATYANFENNTGKFGKPFVMTKVTLRIPYVYDLKKKLMYFHNSQLFAKIRI